MASPSFPRHVSGRGWRCQKGRGGGRENEDLFLGKREEGVLGRRKKEAGNKRLGSGRECFKGVEWKEGLPCGK